MKSTKWILFVASLLLSVAGWSQEFPRGELGFDYSYVRYNPSAILSKSHSLNGGGGTLVFNVNRYFGLKADLQGYGSTTSNFAITPRRFFQPGR
jgi:hypothetical protein